MTLDLALAEADPDLPDYDWWAIKVVVREGRPMHNLTRDEKVAAAKLMRRKGVDGHTAAHRLGIQQALVNKFWKLPDKFDLDLVPEGVVGAPLPKNLVTREDARLLTGN